MVITPSVNKPARLGFFGGTFDPVHYGHLRPAVEMAEHFGLQTLYLMPNHWPAHRGPTGASTEQRIAMLHLAVQGVESLVVDSREALRNEPTYSYDTLVELKAEYPDTTLLFFMGMDSFAAFDTWHNWEGILDLTNLVVVDRPDAAHSEFSKTLLKRQQLSCGFSIIEGQSGVIEQCDVTQLSISATDVRRRIASDKSVRFLLPERVSEYIEHHHLYRSRQ